MSLKQFLTSQAERRKSKASEMEATREDWIEAVGRLVEKINDWLSDADPERVLTISRHAYLKNEERLGSYEIPGLIIKLDNREVRVEPVSRFVVGAAWKFGFVGGESIRGRVDLTDGVSKYRLYRLEHDQSDQWVMIDDGSAGRRPFNQAAFEDAIQSMLE